MAADKLKFCRINSRPISPKTQMEQEKRIRREIANSNERRRMQSINAGFQSLRTLLPHHDGEKLSKVSLPLHYVILFIYRFHVRNIQYPIISIPLFCYYISITFNLTILIIHHHFIYFFIYISIFALKFLKNFGASIG